MRAEKKVIVRTNNLDHTPCVIGFRVQVLSEEAVSTIDEISETKVLRNTECKRRDSESIQI